MTARRGFTLIEVLVALAIVALGMGALMTALASSADSVTYLREKSFAEWVGLNQLSTQRLTAGKPSDGTTEGDINFAGATWHWRQTIATVDTIPGVHRITVQVKRSKSAGTGTGTTLATGTSGANNTNTASNVTSSDSDASDRDWQATVMGFEGEDVGQPSQTRPDWQNGGGGKP